MLKYKRIASVGRLAAGYSDGYFQHPVQNKEHEEQESMLEQLLHNLNSRDKILREDAERRLRALTPEELMQFSLLENTWFQKWSERAWGKIAVGMLGSAVGFGILLGIVSHLIGYKRVGMVNVALAPLLMFTFAVMVTKYRLKPYPHTRQALAACIEELDDVRFIPFLLIMLKDILHLETQKKIHAALMRLLPHLRTGQADNWTSEHKTVLLSSLNSPLTHFEFNMVILKALEQVGAGWAFSTVKKVADIERVTMWTKPFHTSYEVATGQARQLKQAAQECLPFLEQHQQETAQAQTLLRAATPAVSPDTLLRAANAAPATENAEQLLRASGEA